MPTDRARRRDDLDERDRGLLRACIDVYVAEIRSACAEDQGTPEGEPGTLGHSMQNDLRALREKLL